MSDKNKKNKMNISALTAADYNPREITEKSFEGLKFSIDEFGDLSGIVFNLNTGNLVAGHQRKKGLLEKYGDLEIIRINNEYGYIETPDKNRFSVRFVEWDLIKEKAANLAANNPSIQGIFTPEVRLLIDDIKLELPEIGRSLLVDSIQIPISLNENKVALVNNQDEWLGLPVYEDGNEPYKLIVHFDTEEERKEFLELIKVSNFTGKNGRCLSMRWPIQERNDLTSLKFE